MTEKETDLEIRLNALNTELDKMTLQLLSLIITEDLMSNVSNDFIINVESEYSINITSI